MPFVGIAAVKGFSCAGDADMQRHGLEGGA
jgi:hypothetical protein